MTINILNSYISLTREQIETYMKLVFENKYNKKYANTFIEKYINIRYYNYDDEDVTNTIRKKILIHLRKTANDLILDYEKDKQLIENMCIFIYYVLYFDNVAYYKSLEEKVKKVAETRKKLLNVNKKSFEKELYDQMASFIRDKEKLINKFETEDFFIKTTNYKNKPNIFRVNLKFNIKMPKIYSEYAISKAFNNGVVSEDKLKIEYYLATIQVLKDILKQNFKRQYILEFAEGLLEKPKKMKSLLNILNNSAIQEKICLKIRYEQFEKYKSTIYTLMQEGYKIAIILDSSFRSNYKNIESLKMFKYILLNKDLKFFDDIKLNRDKKIVNKIIEI